ncbi:MAG: cytochrome d ubiquinol oxidase subunit II [Spirosomataceae bacterium]
MLRPPMGIGRKVLHLFSKKEESRKPFFAFLSSGFVTAMLMILVAVGLFPNIILSTIDPALHITVYNGSSTEKSLKIMLTFAAVGVPLVAVYTSFVFWTFRGKVKPDEAGY